MALITLTEIKDYLQITGTSSDSLLTIYADYSQAEIESYINTPLNETVRNNEVTHYQNSDFSYFEDNALDFYEDYNYLFTKYRPVSNLVIKEGDKTVSSDDYEVNLDNGTIRLYKHLNDSEDNLKLSYTSGYTTSTIPSALKLVMLDGVRWFWQNKGASTQGNKEVDSKKVKDFSVSYKSDSTVINNNSGNSSIYKSYIAENMTILKKYKQINI